MAEETSASNSHIAKNTVLLYVRMLITMAISLYTSRVVLATLGVEDFGIYNVVGGVVTMFSLLSGSILSAISRFMTYELGRGDKERLKIVFSTSVTIQLLMSAVILIVAETIGLWILNTQLSIPEGRMHAANVVLQCSVITFILGLISAPYNAAVISHERMSFFAAVSISEAVVRLGLVIILQHLPADKLIAYSIFLATLALAARVAYGIYCSKHFDECHLKITLDKGLIKEMAGFAGWNFWGCGSALLMNHGVNILVNVYFGVAFNAARGIATQAETAIGQFTNNFTTALNPQITKSYAKGDVPHMLKLVFSGSKFSFFLMLIVGLPIIMETDFIVNLWLKNAPDYAVLFIRLTTVISMLSVVSCTMITAMLATGRIRNYQLVVGGLGMLIFPLVWGLYALGLPVYVSYFVHFTIFALQLVARLVMLRKMIGLDVHGFVANVIWPDVKVITIAIVAPLIMKLLIADGIVKSISVLAVCVVSTCAAAYFVGLSGSEKVAARNMLGSLVNKAMQR